MIFSDINGLKFPDDYIVKFFFKEGLHNQPGKVLELGSSNGNNLMLFYQYGWETHGVDMSEQAVSNANGNFELVKKENSALTHSFTFYQSEMLSFIEHYNGPEVDVLMFPNCLNYLDTFSANKMFQLLAQKKILKKNGLLFIRLRSPKDYRNGKGKRLDTRTYQMESNETNESGCLNTFYNEAEATQLIGSFLKYSKLKLYTCDFSINIGSQFVFNSDIILWCNIQTEE